jgi:hypothetical protein
MIVCAYNVCETARSSGARYDRRRRSPQANRAAQHGRYQARLIVSVFVALFGLVITLSGPVREHWPARLAFARSSPCETRG